MPFLSPFHTQRAIMSAIYKCYKGSELEDVLVARGVIADGSVDRACFKAQALQEGAVLLKAYVCMKHLVS